jgi:hypothetical protein
MLHVTYEAVEDLELGRLAQILEDRGRIQVRLDRNASLADVVRQLNVEIEDLMSSASWFQLWKDEIVSRATPASPLRIQYLLHREEPGCAVVRERKGLVRVHIDPALSVDHFAAAMNPASKEFLRGGQWFQLFAGEIVDMTPEPMSQV